MLGDRSPIAPRAEAKAVIDHWNEQLAAGREMPWSPTIRAALIAGLLWLDVDCPGCGTSRAFDLRTTAIRSPRSAPRCSDCNAAGVRTRRRWRDCLVAPERRAGEHFGRAALFGGHRSWTPVKLSRGGCTWSRIGADDAAGSID
jgi:hypothetical protein